MSTAIGVCELCGQPKTKIGEAHTALCIRFRALEVEVKELKANMGKLQAWAIGRALWGG